MTIEQQLLGLLSVKNQIRSALQQKGASFDENTIFSEYPAKIQQLLSTDTSSGNLTFELINGLVYPDTLTLKSSALSVAIQSAMQNSQIKALKVESGIVSLPISYLLGATRLKTVDLGQEITSLGNSVFRGCTALENLLIPASVTSVGANLVQGCSLLKEIDIRGGAIVPISFAQGCTELTKVTLANSINLIASNAFSGCTKLATINMENIQTVGGSAFGNCNSIISLIMPKLNNTSSSSFAGLANLEIIDFGQNAAFYSSTLNTSAKVKQLVFKAPNNIEFRSSAFTGMTGLKYIEIQAATMTLNSGAFNNLTACEAVKINAVTPPSVSGAAFTGFDTAKFKIYVPDASVDAYKAKAGWTTLAAYIFPMSSFVMPTI